MCSRLHQRARGLVGARPLTWCGGSLPSTWCGASSRGCRFDLARCQPRALKSGFQVLHKLLRCCT
jgi:hypothetical protein